MNTQHAKHQLSRLSEMVESIEKAQTRLTGFIELLQLPASDNRRLYYKSGEIEGIVGFAEEHLKILESHYYTKLTALTSQAYKDIVEVKS